MAALKLFASRFSPNSRNYSNYLYLFALLIFFWTVFDGIIAYTVPLLLVDRGFSLATTGIIIGTSSLAGAGFDLLFCHLFKNPTFRRMYMMMFALCLMTPLVIWYGQTLWLYLLAMALWGIYYDLRNYGCLDFVESSAPVEQQTQNFGIIQVFEALGFILAPLLTGLILIESLSFAPFLMGFTFLGVAFILFLLLLWLRNSRNYLVSSQIPTSRPAKKLKSFRVWQKGFKKIYPVLLLIMLLNIIDAFFWTIGPLLAATFDLDSLNGLFLASYTLPYLLTGWFVGYLAERFGQIKLVLLAFGISSFLLILMNYTFVPTLMIGLSFLIAFFMALAWPATNGIYTNYMSDVAIYNEDLETLEDFFENLGYIIGPILAGILAELFGYNQAFALLGLGGLVVALLLIKPFLKLATVSATDQPDHI